MFIYSRFVVVDDKEHHLSGIKQSLDVLRLDCHSKLYTDESVADWVPLPGTRMLFLDQNLTTGATFGSTNSPAFSALADVVRKLICPESGPYGLILWAEQPELEQLKTFMFERFTDDDSRLLPVFFTALKKGDYINTTNGEVTDPQKLRNDIFDRISENPQLTALLSWEADVAAAMDAVLRSVVNLVPVTALGSDQFSSELGQTLYGLSQAGAGIKRAMESPREAINRVLVPILADRIIEHDPASKEAFDWKQALVKPTNSPSVKAQALLNSAVHLSFAKSAGSAAILPTELGAVVKLPEDDLSAFLKNRLGLSDTEFREALFKVSEVEWAKCRPRLIRIGAPCDSAQPKPGPLAYLFALEWPFANAGGANEPGTTKTNFRAKSSRIRNDLEWQSPILDFDDSENPGRISAFKNLVLSVSKDEAKDWIPVYRFRDELVSEITHSYARYIARIGIVTLPE
jgi:hypothetical protein